VTSTVVRPRTATIHTSGTSVHHSRLRLASVASSSKASSAATTDGIPRTGLRSVSKSSTRRVVTPVSKVTTTNKTSDELVLVFDVAGEHEEFRFNV
jgi:hypothetical protein